MASMNPVRICCGKRHFGATCPDGKVMCCLCFDRVRPEELFEDMAGERWDICDRCGQAERGL